MAMRIIEKLSTYRWPLLTAVSTGVKPRSRQVSCKSIWPETVYSQRSKVRASQVAFALAQAEQPVLDNSLGEKGKLRAKR
jgi:hypothetical protein